LEVLLALVAFLEIAPEEVMMGEIRDEESVEALMRLSSSRPAPLHGWHGLKLAISQPRQPHNSHQ
jgi:hypothetical protein